MPGNYVPLTLPPGSTVISLNIVAPDNTNLIGYDADTQRLVIGSGGVLAMQMGCDIELNAASIHLGDVSDNSQRLNQDGLVLANGTAFVGDSVLIEGIQVLSTQQGAIANATGAGDVVAQLNAALAAIRAHGLIAT